MNLRTGRPVWLADDPKDLRTPGLSSDLECEVVIIGGGVTAALALHRLVRSGFKVVVLDRRAVARGSTAASTGLLLYQTDSSLAELTRFHNRETAARAYALGRQAVREIGVVVRELGLDCGFKNKRSLYVASDRGGVQVLRREARAELALGYSAKLISQSDLADSFGLIRPTALENAGNAQVDAYRLTRGIFEHYFNHPQVRFFQHTTVSKICEENGRVEVKTSRGFCVRGHFALIAAGYESARFVRSPLVRLHSTYVIASPPFPAGKLWPAERLMWDTARPYFYLRLTPDHRVIFGGQDEPFANAIARDRLLPRKTVSLEKQFAELFPQYAFKADFAWTGTFAETLDGLPCIGPLRKGSPVYCALGYGGNGITFSQIAARLFAARCLGKPNPDERFFRLDRKVKVRREGVRSG